MVPLRRRSGASDLAFELRKLHHCQLDLQLVSEVAAALEPAFEVESEGEGAFEVSLAHIPRLLFKLTGDEGRDFERARHLGTGSTLLEERAGAGQKAELAPDHVHDPQSRFAGADQGL